VDTSLVRAMEEYLAAGASMDLDRMDALYAVDFENVRTDRSGNRVTLTKPEFMAQLRALKEAGATLEAADDAEFLTTTAWDGQGAVAVRRVKGGRPVLYTFVWRMRDGRPAELVREFTVEEDLTGLIRAVRQDRG
jgi:ketosteroid isomerase-like protein